MPVQRDDEIGRLSRTFNSMAQIIDERERRIAASHCRLQNLLDHMGQAIVVFDAQGRLTEERSRLAERIFGASAGATVVDQLYPVSEGAEMEREAFQAWVEAAFTGDAAQFKEKGTTELMARFTNDMEAIGTGLKVGFGFSGGN